MRYQDSLEIAAFRILSVMKPNRPDEALSSVGEAGALGTGLKLASLTTEEDWSQQDRRSGAESWDPPCSAT